MDSNELLKAAPEVQKIVAGVPIAEIVKAIVLPSADALGKYIGIAAGLMVTCSCWIVAIVSQLRNMPDAFTNSGDLSKSLPDQFTAVSVFSVKEGGWVFVCRHLDQDRLRNAPIDVQIMGFKHLTKLFPCGRNLRHPKNASTNGLHVARRN